MEETAETIYLVLPGASAPGGQGGSLSERELEAVAGGEDATSDVHWPTCICNPVY